MVTLISVVILYTLWPVSNALLISEVNNDCPRVDENNIESCEFIEIYEPSCNRSIIWQSLPPTYFLLVEPVGATQQLSVCLLLNLTGQRVTPGNPFFTICNTGGNDSCDVTFDSLLLAKVCRAEHISSYLLNGNEYPMVAILLETKDHNGVWNLFVPEESNQTWC